MPLAVPLPVLLPVLPPRSLSLGLSLTCLPLSLQEATQAGLRASEPEVCMLSELMHASLREKPP